MDFCLQYELGYTYDRHGILGQLTAAEKARLMTGRTIYFEHLDPHRMGGAGESADPDGPGRKKRPGQMTSADRDAAKDWIAEKQAGG